MQVHADRVRRVLRQRRHQSLYEDHPALGAQHSAAVLEYGHAARVGPVVHDALDHVRIPPGHGVEHVTSDDLGASSDPEAVTMELLQTCSARGFIPKAEIATVDLVGYLGD